HDYNVLLLQPPQDNPKIPGASGAIELKYSDKFGRHVVATRDINAGVTIMVHTPQISNMNNVCNNAYQQYIRSRPGVSIKSVRIMKELNISNAGIAAEFVDIVPKPEGLLSRMKNYIDHPDEMERNKENTNLIGSCTREISTLEKSSADDISDAFKEFTLTYIHGKLDQKISQLEVHYDGLGRDVRPVKSKFDSDSKKEANEDQLDPENSAEIVVCQRLSQFRDAESPRNPSG
ncbi:hypothetical protein PV325_008895, partial [Microctonus aethiopoides]